MVYRQPFRMLFSFLVVISLALSLDAHPAQRRRSPRQRSRERIVARRNQPSTATPKLSFVPTLDSPLQKGSNSAWCATFQMAWDELKADINEPVQVLGAEEIANRLNQATFRRTDIEKKHYYATFGSVQDGILAQIQETLRARFNTRSELPNEYLLNLARYDQVLVAYSYLNVDVPFKHHFFKSERPLTFRSFRAKKRDVSCFGPSPPPGHDGKPDLYEQIEVLYYDEAARETDSEFAVDLCKHTSPYQVVLARTKFKPCFEDMLARTKDKMEEFQNRTDYAFDRQFKSHDRLSVPDIAFKLTRHFTELEGKTLLNEKYKGWALEEAVQMIDFTLSRTGVALRSEARIASARSRPPEPRRFIFDRPFLIFIQKRAPNSQPFYAKWISDASLMKAF